MSIFLIIPCQQISLVRAYEEKIISIKLKQTSHPMFLFILFVLNFSIGDFQDNKVFKSSTENKNRIRKFWDVEVKRPQSEMKFKEILILFVLICEVFGQLPRENQGCGRKRKGIAKRNRNDLWRKKVRSNRNSFWMAMARRFL